MVAVRDLLINTATSFGVEQKEDQTSVFTQLGEAGEAVGVVLERKEKRDADAFNAKATSDLALYGPEAIENSRVEAQSPDQISETFFKKYDQKFNELRNQAPNDVAKRELEDRYQKLKTQFGTRALGTEVNETQAARTMALANSYDDAAVSVRNGGDLDLSLAVIDQASLGAESYLSPTQIQERKQFGIAEAKTARLDYLMEQGQTKEVTKLINDDEFNKELNSKQIGVYREAVASVKQSRKKQTEVVDYMLGKGDFFDVGSKANKQAVDDIFNSALREDFFGKDPVKRAQAYTATLQMSNAGITPKTVQNFVESSYIGQRGGNKDLAYQFVADLYNLNPRAAETLNLSDKQLEEALMYTRLKDMGVSEADTKNMVNETIYPQDPGVVKARQESLKEVSIDPDIEGLFDNSFLPFTAPDFVDISGKKESIEAKYKDLFDKFYLLTGDEQAAKERTDDVIKSGNVIGLSMIASDDPVIMDYPPEAFYKDPVFHSLDGEESLKNTSLALREQLLIDVKQELGRDVDIDDIRIVPTRLTIENIKNNQPPVYTVQIIAEDGGPEDAFQYVWEMDKVTEKVRAKNAESRRKKGIKQKVDDSFWFNYYKNLGVDGRIIGE